MKLYFDPISTTSQPVLLFCSEERIKYEPVLVDLMKGEHYQEPFASLNPNRLVPVLQDGDFVLTESSAILKFLAETNGSPAYPRDLRARAKVNELMDWLNTGFYREYGYHLIYPQLYPHHARKPEEANRVTLAWGAEKADAAFKLLNQHWLGGGRTYLCGSQITIADYFGAAIVELGATVGIDLGPYPNVDRWMKTMRSIPSWAKVFEARYAMVAALKGKSFTTIRSS